MRREAERSLATPSGMFPFAIKLQTAKNFPAVVALLASVLKCSKFQPEGPDPEHLGSLERVAKNNGSERLMD